MHGATIKKIYLNVFKINILLFGPVRLAADTVKLGVFWERTSVEAHLNIQVTGSYTPLTWLSVEVFHKGWQLIKHF